jgi:hypothetical protein
MASTKDLSAPETDAHISTFQSSSLRPYLAAVRATLTAALTLENFASQVRTDWVLYDVVGQYLMHEIGCRTAQQARSGSRVRPRNIGDRRDWV